MAAALRWPALGARAPARALRVGPARPSLQARGLFRRAGPVSPPDAQPIRLRWGIEVSRFANPPFAGGGACAARTPRVCRAAAGGGGGGEEGAPSAPAISKNLGRGGKTRSVFVSGLPGSSDWRGVKEHFRAVGDVSHVKMLQGAAGGAIVTYKTSAEARAAVQVLDGTEVKGGAVIEVVPDRLTARRAGDWKCSGCGELAFAYRDACIGCGAPRETSAEARGAGEGGAPAFPAGSPRRFGETREGDWKCTGCGELVFAGRRACPFCDTMSSSAAAAQRRRANKARSAAAEAGRRVGDWNCGSCGKLNFASRQQCFDPTCKAGRPAEAGAPAKAA